MKRIPSKMAVSTLLGVMPIDTTIKVLDFPTVESISCKDFLSAKELYTGNNDLNSYKYVRIMNAQVRRVETQIGTAAQAQGLAGQLVIMICTAAEQY